MGNPLFINPDDEPTCRVCGHVIDDPEFDELGVCSDHLDRAFAPAKVEIHWNGLCECTCGCMIPLDVQGQLICGDCACGDHAGGDAA